MNDNYRHRALPYPTATYTGAQNFFSLLDNLNSKILKGYTRQFTHSKILVYMYIHDHIDNL